MSAKNHRGQGVGTTAAKAEVDADVEGAADVEGDAEVDADVEGAVDVEGAAADAESSVAALFCDDAADEFEFLDAEVADLFCDDAADAFEDPVAEDPVWTMRTEFKQFKAEVAAAEVAALVCDDAAFLADAFVCGDAAEDPANSVLFSCPSHNDCTALSSSDDEEDLHVLAYLLTN